MTVHSVAAARRRHAQWLTRQAPLAKEIADAQSGEDRFLAVQGQNLELDFAFPDREDASAGSPCEKTICRRRSSVLVFPASTLARKSCGSKGCFASPSIKALPRDAPARCDPNSGFSD